MSGITREQAQQVLDALIQAQIEDPSGSLGSVSVGGRTVTYRSAEDMISLINYWRRTVAELSRVAAGGSRISMKRATFR